MKKFLSGFCSLDEAIERFMKKKWAPFVLWPFAILMLYGVFFLFCFQPKMYEKIPFNGEASKALFNAFIIIYEVLVLFYFVMLLITRKMTLRKGVFLVFLLSVGFVFPFNMGRVYNDDSFTHDYHVFGEGGHWAIIYDIYATGKIPSVNMSNQYYQPKFYHFLMAMFMKFNSFLVPAFPGSNDIVPNIASNTHFASFTLQAYVAFETARIFLTLEAILILFFIYKTIVELNLSKRASIISAFLIMFTPVFWFLSAYKNNDALATLFMFAALYAALRYRKTHSYYSLVSAAVCIGFGMETKLSAAMVAFPVATVFAFELLKQFRENKKWVAPKKKEFIKFVIQMCVFAVIVFPLGLGGAILMKVKYNMPIGYVWDLIEQYGTDYFMYISPKTYSAFSRLIVFPSPDLFWDMFNVRYAKVNGVLNPYGYIDFNCWTAFLKTGLWSEAYLSAGYAFGDVISKFPLLFVFMGVVYLFAIFVGVFFVIGSLYYIVKRIISIIKKEDQSNSFVFYLIAVTFVSSAISYMAFCLRYPVGCTMNARYAMLLYLPIAIVVGTLADKILLRVSIKK